MNIKHGNSRSRLYSQWQTIKQRCMNPNARLYKYYGAIGIEVSKEWDSFDVFMKWSLENGYDDTKYPERKDKKLGYTPENTIWREKSLVLQQRLYDEEITIGNKTKKLSEWAVESGLTYKKVCVKLKRGLKGEEIFKNQRGKVIEFNGQRKKLYEWLNEFGIKRDCFYKRIKMGFSIEEALSHAHHKYRVSLAVKGKKNPKIIYQLTLDGDLINTFPSCSAASKETGLHQGGISSCARGIHKTIGGFKWSYKI